MWSHLHWSMEPGVPKGLDDPVTRLPCFFPHTRSSPCYRFEKKTPTIWCEWCENAPCDCHQATHSQKALLFSFDLSPYKIYKATNPPFLKQTVFLGDIPLSTPGLHTAWRPHVKKSQLGAPPAEFPMLLQKPTSKQQFWGYPKRSSRFPHLKFHGIPPKRASGSKGGTNRVIVLHRFQWCCFCLHPGTVDWSVGWKVKTRRTKRREWPGLSRSVCFNVSFSSSRLVVSSEAGLEYRTTQSKGLHAVRGRWFLFTMMLYFKVLVSTQPMVHPSCTSHLPAVSHL